MSLGDAGAPDARGAHLSEHLVQPLQRAVQVQLDPAGGAGHRLPPATKTRNVKKNITGSCLQCEQGSNKESFRKNTVIVILGKPVLFHIIVQLNLVPT